MPWPLAAGISAARQARVAEARAEMNGLAKVRAAMLSRLRAPQAEGSQAGAARPAGDQLADAVVAFRARADVKVCVQRLGQLPAKELPEALAGHPAHHFADEMALGQGVVAARRARLPPRGLAGQGVHHFLPVIDVFVGHRLIHPGKPRRMAHEVPHLHLVFAVLRELRPVALHRRVEVEFAPVGQQQGGQRGHGLGGGIDVDNGVLLPGQGARPVPITSPKIDHRLAFDADRDAGPHVAALLEVLLENSLDALKLRIAGPVNFQCSAPPISNGRATYPTIAR